MEVDSETVDDLIKCILEATDKGLLIQCDTGYEDAYDKDLFIRAQRDGLNSLKKVRSVLHDLERDGRPQDATSLPPPGIDRSNDRLKNVLKGSCAACVILCATYHCSDCADWSNTACQEEAKALLQDILDVTRCPSVFRLLCGYSEVEDPPDLCMFRTGTLSDVSLLLKRRLNKLEWKREPATSKVYYWCLRHMKHPFVGEHLSFVLPPALLFVDDHQPANKLLGVRCLQHIINEVDLTELRWYGRIEVIFQVLRPLLYHQEPVLIGELLPCMLGVLSITERVPTDPSKRADAPNRLPNRYDQIFQTILSNMEGEQKLALRREWAKSLEGFINVMKINVLRHMKRLLRIITSYLQVSDGKDEISRMYTLNTLKAVIVQTWPRIPNHSVAMTKALLTLLYEISTADRFNITDKARDTLQTRVEECFRLLQMCDKSTVTPAIKGVLSTSVPNQFMKESLQKVIQDR